MEAGKRKVAGRVTWGRSIVAALGLFFLMTRPITMFWTTFFAVLCALFVWDLARDLVNDFLMLPFVWLNRLLDKRPPEASGKPF